MVEEAVGSIFDDGRLDNPRIQDGVVFSGIEGHDWTLTVTVGIGVAVVVVLSIGLGKFVPFG